MNTFKTPAVSTRLNFTAFLTLTSIVGLAAIQLMGTDASLPLATAAAMLVFCSRQRASSTWDLLMHVCSIKATGTIEGHMPGE